MSEDKQHEYVSPMRLIDKKLARIPSQSATFGSRPIVLTDAGKAWSEAQG